MLERANELTERLRDLEQGCDLPDRADEAAVNKLLTNLRQVALEIVPVA